jgi:thiosulfate/3-mercaptopyruvate sulfurtransferase
MALLAALGWAVFPVLADVYATDWKPLVNVRELAALDAKQTVIIDTRPHWAYLIGHIPTAVHLGDWQDYTRVPRSKTGILTEDKGFLAEKLRAGGIDYAKTVVLYGDAGDKWRADGRFFWMFERLGFSRVGVLDGGYDTWKNAGQPLERGAGTATPSTLTPESLHFRDDVRADQQWILQRIGTPSVKIIDNRERKEFDGATPYGSKRGGHIPGAIHIDWRDFYAPDGRLKPKEDLLALLKKFNISAADEVVVYCTGGVRSAMAYFVFRHLRFNVRNYDGSWWEWSANPSLPAEL